MSRPTARVVIIEGNKIALLERHRQGRHYFVFPGGGIEPGETPEAAALREGWEETGLELSLDRLVARVTFRGNLQHFFLAHPVGGMLGAGTGPEMTGQFSEKDGTYRAVWVGLDELPRLPVLPESIAGLAARHPHWPKTPPSFTE